MEYNYTALDKQGKKIYGIANATNELDLEAKLKQSELDLITCTPSHQWNIRFWDKITDQDTILITIHMYQMEKSGVSILESIEELRDNFHNPKVQQVMMDIYDSLKNGKMLSEAFAQHPKVFNKVYINMIRMGEKSGNLEEIFLYLQEHEKWLYDIKNKTKKSIRYPLFLLILVVMVISVMVGYVIPKLTDFLLAQNIPLPGYTIALISISGFFFNNGVMLLISPFAVYILTKILYYRSQEFAVLLDRWILKIPLVGSLIHKIEVARFCNFFLITYRSGMGIIECLKIATEGCNNQDIKKSLQDVIGKVSDGQNLTQSLIETGKFPSLITRMFHVGEFGGNLEGTLQNVNSFYDDEIKTAIDSMISFLEPAMTIVMGIIMAWITLSVFGPIYSNFG